MSEENPHDRNVTDDAFYKWLLSDHPKARAERDRRRAATYLHQRDQAPAVRAWADKISAWPDAPQALRDLASSMGPQADESVAWAEADFAEPDDLYVARLRAPGYGAPAPLPVSRPGTPLSTANVPQGYLTKRQHPHA